MESAVELDKRKFDRLLCNDRFSETIVWSESAQFGVHSINFNHKGMGVFSGELIKESDSIELSFRYKLDDCVIVVEALPATLIYAHETEVGHQYGFRFDLSDIPPETLEMLKEVEANLTANAFEGRYNLCD